MYELLYRAVIYLLIVLASTQSHLFADWQLSDHTCDLSQPAARWAVESISRVSMSTCRCASIVVWPYMAL